MSTSNRPLIIGLNKYSHDASCCVVDASTGKILYAQAKERITRRKHDGGATGSLLSYALEYVGATLDDIAVVVSNNHHYRLHPFERRAPFAAALGYVQKDILDPMNLVPGAKHYELSHHLAHAYSAAGTCPFEEALVLCMDGMGESYRAMAEDLLEDSSRSSTRRSEGSVKEKLGDRVEYMHDLRLLRSLGEAELARFTGVPVALVQGAGYREAESAYLLEKVLDQTLSGVEDFGESGVEAVSPFVRGDESGIERSGERHLSPLFKRWCRERSPPELYNHGFENMDSLGAVYSRVSSHVLGDWNACGKVMGLAPWDGRKHSDAQEWIGDKAKSDSVSLGKDFLHRTPLMTGDPFHDPALAPEVGMTVHWDTLETLPHANEWSDDKFDFYASLAASVQSDLEACAIRLITSLRQRTPSRVRSLVLTGGVALNSVLNGLVRRLGTGGTEEGSSLGFDSVWIPPAPGDEGVAVGCALYGLQRWRESQARSASSPLESSVPELSNAIDLVDYPATELSSPVSRTVPTSLVVPEGAHDTGPYTGSSFPPAICELALLEYAPWLTVIKRYDQDQGQSELRGRLGGDQEPDGGAEQIPENSRDDSWEGAVADAAGSLLAQGTVIGWFQGRSEFGQRALGARSILADPRDRSMRRRVNGRIKQREWYRPLAPAVLAEYTHDWFEMDKCKDANGDVQAASPYMSITAQIRPEKVLEIPAVAHVDGSARLQTVTKKESPLFHRLISAFYQCTRTPLVLNTSFNGKGEPIVESPSDAIRCFLASGGQLDRLFLGPFEVIYKPFEEAMAGEDSLVYAQQVYLSEVTSVSGREEQPVKVRIQTGTSSSSGESNTEEDQWTVLPSALHLQLLQLLQVNTDSIDNGDDGVNIAETGVSVGELRDVILETWENEVGDESNERKEMEWDRQFESALRWLYERQLIYFDAQSA